MQIDRLIQIIFLLLRHENITAMRNDQALFDGLPIAVVEIFLCQAVVFLRVKFPVEHVFDALDDAGEFQRGKPFFDLRKVDVVAPPDQTKRKLPKKATAAGSPYWRASPWTSPISHRKSRVISSRLSRS